MLGMGCFAEDGIAPATKSPSLVRTFAPGRSTCAAGNGQGRIRSGQSGLRHLQRRRQSAGTKMRREACEAYIKSQAHEGWRFMCNKFDDGGLSGASLERPALQALLDEVRSGASEIEQMAFFARFLLREQPLASQTTSESRPSHTFSKPNYLPG